MEGGAYGRLRGPRVRGGLLLFCVFPPSNFDSDLSTLQAGTYDSLAHLHFEPPPTPGSSGGPIVDEESGSVIGVMLGTQLVSQVEGVRGWGVPSEMIFEVRASCSSLGKSEPY